MLGNLFNFTRSQVTDALSINAPQRLTLRRSLTWLRGHRGLLIIAVQLGLLLLVLDRFGIEDNFGFPQILPLIFVGFLVNAVLPLQLRLPFFLLLSFAAIVAVLGAKQGIGLIVVGLGLISLCHLPVSHTLRVLMVVGAGAVLAVLRAEWIETPWEALPLVILPILGAMFMFRLMIYLYDLRHEKEPVSIWQRLSYFFMVPNVCFLLFPVIDYQTFRRSYYDEAPETIYQKGLLWIMRGAVHLLLYRLVYHHLLPSSADVVDLAGLVQFMLATYALYLRISGLFHLVIGIMCLFGFNLPETHHLYYLASSFTDYWRRINIYWKDFMLKLFYYPALMRFRRWGMKTALVLATGVVFTGTWLLHSYQWFWLQGTFPLGATDALFWGILGVLVIVNSLREASQGRKRTLKKPVWSIRSATIYSVKVVGTFTFICVLWSLWSSESVEEWLALVEVAASGSLRGWIILAGSLVLLAALGVVAQYVNHRGWNFTLVGQRPNFGRSGLYVVTTCALLLIVSAPQLETRLGDGTSAWIASIRSEKLNTVDLADMERGYYEGLLDGGGFVSTMRSLRGMPVVEAFDDAGGTIGTGDVRVQELRPQVEFQYSGVNVRTNRWGMRDKDYALDKAPGTYRIALLGASHVMGNGVNNEQMFDPLLEKRLNDHHAGGEYEKYEVLNFAVTGYGPVQVSLLASEKLAPFRPDAVFFFANPDEIERAINKFAWPVYRGETIAPEFLADVVDRGRVGAGMSMHKINRRLRPYGEDLLRWSYERVVDSAKKMGANPVWVFLPWVHEKTDPDTYAYLTRLAREAGFSVISLDGVYDGGDRAALQVASWDTHPNARAHRLIANRLYDEFVANDEQLGLQLRSSAAAQHASASDIP